MLLSCVLFRGHGGTFTLKEYLAISLERQVGDIRSDCKVNKSLIPPEAPRKVMLQDHEIPVTLEYPSLEPGRFRTTLGRMSTMFLALF